MLLVFVALWPFVHLGLVARYEINPWKLGGFAMYTTPVPPVQVVLFEQGRAGGMTPIDERLLPPLTLLHHLQLLQRPNLKKKI